MDKIQMVTIEVEIGENTLYRRFQLIDGKAPSNMQENIDEMVEKLLNNEEDF